MPKRDETNRLETPRNRRWCRRKPATARSPQRRRQPQQSQKRFEVYYPELEFCTDNGAMIAFAGAMRLKANPSPSHHQLQLQRTPPLAFE